MTIVVMSQNGSYFGFMPVAIIGKSVSKQLQASHKSVVNSKNLKKLFILFYNFLLNIKN